MNWNGDKTNEYFIRKYNSINPNSLKGKPLHDLFDAELAIKNVYHLCACDAWTKERLENALQQAISGDVYIEREANNPEKYKDVYKKQAQHVLNDIQSGKLSFS
jgi:hypothetical protein